MINKNSLINFFEALNNKSNEFYDEFNKLDGQLGDGDLGITIFKGVSEIYKNRNNFEEDLGKIFLLCAKLFTKVSSSSFGTLTAISFLVLGKEYKGRKEIKNIDILSGLEKIMESISDRGKSNLGDKTILDSINEIINSIKLSRDKDLGYVTYEACQNALIKFKGKECKIGRARMFQEKSKTLNDPGMFAFSKLSLIFIK